MSVNQKRVVLVLAGLLILVCTFFFLYQPGTDKVFELEQETSSYNRKISYLSTMQLQVNEMKKITPSYKKETEKFMKKFPSRMTQQKAIWNVYRMMVKSGIRVTAVTPGVEQIFMKNGQFTDATASGTASEDTSGGTQTGDETTGNTGEDNEEKQLEVTQMTGKVTSYEISLSGSLRQINKALDWISENKEHMSTTAVALTYDSSSGKLSGTMTVNYYAMNGNGVPYEDPDISGILIGSKNIFGTIK